MAPIPMQPVGTYGEPTLEAQEPRMRRARLRLLREQYDWYGRLALNLYLRESDQLPTAGTDGTWCLYNPGWTSTLDDDQLMTVWAHEVTHCANGHHWRIGCRNPLRWNVAGDYSINNQLALAGLPFWPGALIEPAFNGLSTETIYEKLPDPLPLFAPQPVMLQPGEGDQEGDEPQGGSGDGDEGPADAYTRADWAVFVQDANAYARSRGTLPADIERGVGEAMEPLADWRTELREFVQFHLPVDSDWSRPDRRNLWRGIYLPSWRKENVGPVVAAVDTSGSIDRETLDQFCGELTGILHDARPSSLVVIYADAAPRSYETYTPQDERIACRPVGGGGTAFQPTFDWVEAQVTAGVIEEPCCLIYLTDLDGDNPTPPERYDVLWVVPQKDVKPDTAPPFGRLVVLDKWR